MPRREELQDEQWKILKPLLPSPLSALMAGATLVAMTEPY